VTRTAVSALVRSALASCATSFARASSLPLCSADVEKIAIVCAGRVNRPANDWA
jgi:hypothetical protein